MCRPDWRFIGIVSEWHIGLSYIDIRERPLLFYSCSCLTREDFDVTL